MKDRNSARDPIKELRKCSPEEKRELAIELARTRDIRIIDELIRMSEGRRNGLFSRYSEASQLIGLEALGETGSSYAIQYLTDLNKRYDEYIEDVEIKYAPVGKEFGLGKKRYLWLRPGLSFTKIRV